LHSWFQARSVIWHLTSRAGSEDSCVVGEQGKALQAVCQSVNNLVVHFQWSLQGP
jgi:hypothetical protein